MNSPALSAKSLNCPHCGAPTPLLEAPRARCLYCTASFEVPPSLAAPLAADARLRAGLDAMFHRVENARRRGRATSLALVLLAVVVLALGGFGLIGVLLTSGLLAGSGGAAAPSLIIVGLVYGGIVLSIGIGVVVGRRQTRRRLAGLPFLAVEADSDQQLRCTCPQCAAPLQPDPSSLVARCGHCQAESLLPAVLVANRLQAAHARLIDLRLRGDVLTGAAASTIEAVNYSVGIALLVIGFLLGGGLCLFAIFQAPPHLQGIERVMVCVMPGLFGGGVFIMGGILSILRQRALNRQPPRS